MLEDLIAAATNNALEKAEQAARQEMSKITQGMLPNIPGLDISQLGL
ncbi:MAG: YbaB/EbfC family nucleoid-associated protein [Pseudomonadota bacterium]